MTQVTTPILPSLHDAELAKALNTKFNSKKIPNVLVKELPDSVLLLVKEILAQVALGNAVSLSAMPRELTTQQAATVLGVSRPFVIKLLEQGELAYRKVGSHRRIAFEEVLAHQERSKVGRFATIDALIADAQELGMGY
jgi:excisionase family DNA binding protein